LPAKDNAVEAVATFVGNHWVLEFRACFVQLTRRKATSLFSYAKPNKQVRVLAFTSFDGYEPEGREFESLRAHHFPRVQPGHMGEKL
jgi:hypothetical protein